MNVTVSGVASSASSVTLAEGHSQRQMLSIYNASTQILYINFDNAAAISSGNYVLQIAAGAYFELPITARGVCPHKITGIWASANGFAQVTQYTAQKVTNEYSRRNT